MKPVSKQTLLIVLVVILIAMNTGLVAFMWYTQRQQNGPETLSTARFLIRELNFSKEQAGRYMDMQQQFSDGLSPIRQNERRLHDRLFNLMHADTPDTAEVNALIDSMGRIRVNIEALTFIHFRQVRALCNTEQKEKFDRIISETMRRMGPRVPGHDDRPPGPPPGGDQH